MDGQTHDGQGSSAGPPAEKNPNTTKAEAKLEKALEYIATHAEAEALHRRALARI